MYDLKTRDGQDQLINFSIGMLKSMIVPENGLFCSEKKTNGAIENDSMAKSLRYTVISLLGLSKARRNGFSIPFDLNTMFHSFLEFAHKISIGDAGLLLWLNCRLDKQYGKSIFDRIYEKLDKSSFDQLNNMELSWLLIGMTYFNESHKDDGIELTDSIVDYLLENRSAPSGLFYHIGTGLRRKYPNFANIIYPIHALSIHCRIRGKTYIGNRVYEAVESLRGLQQKNGGWPWIYNAEDGIVVEPYEIYSVHQDAMAPMAFFEVNKATGYYTDDLITKGYNWLYGYNELSINMIDEENGLIYRSIRRKYPYNKIKLYSKTFFDMIGKYPETDDYSTFLEVNRVTRPFHAGWILEAHSDNRKFDV